MILNDMIGGNGKRLIRPQTAATSNRKDESRIKSKLKMLEKIEQRIEDDIEEFNSKRKPTAQQSGVRLTKAMLLDASQCDQLDEIQSVRIYYVKSLDYHER